MFSKAGATSLPSHRPVVDLLPGTMPPKGRRYSPLGLEQRAMEECTHGSLAAGLIWPSSSTAAAGFFFVEKKDESLRPCVDDRWLNDIIVTRCP